MNQRGKPEADPLWLPRGSVRALIAIGIIAMWAVLESGIAGGAAGGAPDYVRALATSVAAGYGLLRRWESVRGPLAGGGPPDAGRDGRPDGQRDGQQDGQRAQPRYGHEGEDRR